MNSTSPSPSHPDDYYILQGSVVSTLRSRTLSALSSSSSDSKRGSSDRFNLDVGSLEQFINFLQVLLPNGVLLQMVVEQTISVFELKQIILGKVFESQANCPRVGLMTNSNSFYTLEYICQQGKRARYPLCLRPQAFVLIPEWKTMSPSYLNSTWPFPCSRWSALTRA